MIFYCCLPERRTTGRCHGMIVKYWGFMLFAPSGISMSYAVEQQYPATSCAMTLTMKSHQGMERTGRPQQTT